MAQVLTKDVCYSVGIAAASGAEIAVASELTLLEATGALALKFFFQASFANRQDIIN